MTGLRTALALLAGLLPGLFASVPGSAEPGDRPFIIADATGNWGQPSPYLHMRRGPGYLLTSFLFDTLMWKDTNGELQPALARQIEPLDGGLTYRITLAEGAAWHDGRPVTAEDVAFTFGYVERFPLMFGALDAIAGAEPEGADRVLVRLRHPMPSFLPMVAGAMPILPRHVFEGIETPFEFTGPAALTGSGPYLLDRYDPAKGRYIFRSNPGYYGGPPAIDRIALVRMSPIAAIAGLKSGEVDLATSVPVTAAEDLRQAGLALARHSSGHPVRLRFNHRTPRFAGRAVRQAIAHGLDRRRMAETAYLGEAEIWSAGLLASLTEGAAERYPYDPVRARALLAGAGWHPPVAPLRLLAPQSLDPITRLVAAQLAEIGIETRIVLLDQASFEGRIAAGDFDLAMVTSSMLGDPDRMRLTVMGTRSNQDGYDADPALTAALMAQSREANPARRAELLAEAAGLYADALPSYPLVAARTLAAGRPGRPPVYTPGGVAPGIPSILNKQAFTE
ncbi:ABC transporter substrate-binding protein [Rhodovulum sulfidophilum]|uniref:ABC transporter substrate-binding protein n=1 Tax=Rhodovulum sulfidophilum TaxID=35806 RepID=UPI0019237848|nr:hypothetical protein [Rhodovulum sulfidophilum]